jgi:uncharacterized protein YbaR (Trm112 family)
MGEVQTGRAIIAPYPNINRSAKIRPMKQELMAILVCPVCKGKLELNVEQEADNEIITGALHCPRCMVRYPITDTIPNLLPPEKMN